MNSHEALLEILKIDAGLRFTFLDLSRPSLSFEETLEIPEIIFKEISTAHDNILRAASRTLIRSIQPLDNISVQSSNSIIQDISSLSEEIRHSLFPSEFLSHIKDFSPTSLLIRTDMPSIPWELSRINGDVLGIKIPTGRSLLTKRPLRRILNNSYTRNIRVLIIANPTSDLPGAEEEANELLNFFNSSPFFQSKILNGKQASVSNLRTMLQNNDFDVIHYAGHSDYRQTNKRGELALSDMTVNSKYLSKLLEKNPPKLIFLNSCNSGVVESTSMFFDDLNGLAPNFLRVGVNSVIGACWPVIDHTAVQIALSFYKNLINGLPVGRALNRARTENLANYEIPYWLGYSLFGNPNQELINDFSWKAKAIRSGGRIAATSTFTGKSSVHISSLHSFLLSAHQTDTCAAAFGCECIKSEALVYKRSSNIKDIGKVRKLRVGVPGKTGCAIFLYKILEEMQLEKSACEFFELDTAEVLYALLNDVIDVTVLWEPDLTSLSESEYIKVYSEGKHEYTVCVLVTRIPRTLEERTAYNYIVKAYRNLSKIFMSKPQKWSALLSEQGNCTREQITQALEAFDFSYGGATAFESLPRRAQLFIDQEIEKLSAADLIQNAVNLRSLILPENIVGEIEGENANTASKVFADIQWSISSLPLILGKYLSYFS